MKVKNFYKRTNVKNDNDQDDLLLIPKMDSFVKRKVFIDVINRFYKKTDLGKIKKKRFPHFVCLLAIHENKTVFSYKTQLIFCYN